MSDVYEPTSDFLKAVAAEEIPLTDRDLALPLARRELAKESAGMPLFEAATLIANPILIDVLRRWIEPSENAFLDELAREAFAACERASTATE